MNLFFQTNVADIPTPSIQFRVNNDPEDDPTGVVWVQLKVYIDDSETITAGAPGCNRHRKFGFLYFDVRGQLQRGMSNTADVNELGPCEVSSLIANAFRRKVIPITGGNDAGGIVTKVPVESESGKQGSASSVLVKVRFYVDEF